MMVEYSVEVNWPAIRRKLAWRHKEGICAPDCPMCALEDARQVSGGIARMATGARAYRKPKMRAAKRRAS